MKKISDLRKQSGSISQRELAKNVNVTQASISRWEDNPISVSGTSLIKLAIFLMSLLMHY